MVDRGWVGVSGDERWDRAQGPGYEETPATTVTGRDHSASAVPRAIAFQYNPSSTPSAWQTQKHI